MKIVVTGAAGGIGRSLMAVLGEVHEMTGIVRTPRAGGPAGRYIASSNKAAVAAALADADCVIHCALDMRAKGRNFLPANHALNKEVLDGALSGRCRLFVFLSSWVVYSGSDAADGEVYREDQPLALTPKLDGYTRLKIESEAEVTAACNRAGVGYLILRPTIVMGPGMNWSSGVVSAFRGIVIGIAKRTMNLVHVDDLSRQVRLLLERGARNEIFNLGTVDVSTEEYFRQVGIAARLPVRFTPDWVLRAAKGVIPSTFWMFARNVVVSDEKVAEVTGFRSDRPLADYFPRRPAVHRPRTLEEVKQAIAAAPDFRAFGRGYHRWFNRPSGGDVIDMRAFTGVVTVEGDRVRVRAGTPLFELCQYLDARGLAIAALPEFTSITVGACFFVDVHGSSGDLYSLYDLIDEIRYLDAGGEEVVSQRDEAAWAALREKRSGFVLTEVTFRCVPATLMSNRIDWEDESQLDHYLAGGFRAHHSMTIHWYPAYGKLMIYKIDPVPGPVRGAARSIAPFRGLPYDAQRRLLALRLRGRKLQVDRWHRILGPWRKVPLEGLVGFYLGRNYDKLRDMEMVMSREDGQAFLTVLRQRLRSGEIVMRKRGGVGIRFSRAADGRDYVWIELASDDPAFVDRFIYLARETAAGPVKFHRGKYMPPGETA